MNALKTYANLYSDDEDSDPDLNKIDSKKGANKDPGTNYEEVGMDISEDSNNESEDKAPTNRSKNYERVSKDKEAIQSSAREKPSDHKDKSSSHKSLERDRNTPNEKPRESGSNKSDSRSSHRHDNKNDRHKKSRSPDRISKRSRSKDRSKRSRSKDRSKRSRSNDRSKRHKGRRSRSRSKGRKRSRSRSRERRRRSRSRDRHFPDRSRPTFDIKKEAETKLAQIKAAYPDLDTDELVRKGLQSQGVEIPDPAGVKLPSYYNPAVMNPLKIAEQMRKKKLLWGNKSKPAGDSATVTEAAAPKALGGGSLWSQMKFANDSDGKMSEKFKRLMGVKNDSTTSASSSKGNATESRAPKSEDLLNKQATMFKDFEQQYEVARMSTHTHRGCGLGFPTQPFLPKPM